MPFASAPRMLKEFRDFIMKGNVLDLAVAVIIGAAFAKIVAALNTAVLMPLVAAVLGKSDFSQLSFSIGSAKIVYGAVIQASINFAVTGFVLFLVVKAYNRALRKKNEAAPAPPAGPSETDLLGEIRDLLRARA
ncbi:MAG TPA: large conductance mechanosensitive channel protein MscL [Kofleriaceae bacterium]|nr:large conductance mechanosensitive channel protein MscL [Kofleriaceae bacterium]